jgi:hypothetical protein
MCFTISEVVLKTRLASDARRPISSANYSDSSTKLAPASEVAVGQTIPF